MKKAWLVAAKALVGISLVAAAGYFLGGYFPISQYVESSDFITSTDPEVRLAAVREMKEQFVRSNSNLERARIINALNGMAHSAHEYYLFDEIFDGEPFQQFLAGSAETSLANLERYSLSLYPTSYAALMAVFDICVEFRERHFYGAHPDDARMREIEKEVLEHIKLAEQYVGRDLLNAESYSDMANILVTYYQWVGHWYGDLALHYPEHQENAMRYLTHGLEAARIFQAGIAEREGRKDIGLEQKITALLYNLPRYYILSEDGSNDERMRAYIRELIERLRDSPEIHSNFYISLSLARDVQNDPEMQSHEGHTNRQQHAELIRALLFQLREIAKFSPEAEEFLADQGIDSDFLVESARPLNP